MRKTQLFIVHHSQLLFNSSRSRMGSSYLRKCSLLYKAAAADNMAWWMSQQLARWQSNPAVKAVIKFRVTLRWIWLAGCPDSGEGTRVPGLIHLSLHQIIQKRKMEVEPHGNELLLAANLAEHSSTAVKHICESMWSFFLICRRGQKEDNQQYSGFAPPVSSRSRS